MSGDTDQEIVTTDFTDDMRRKRSRRQMHAVSTRGACDVETVVDEHSRLSTACDAGGTRSKFVKNSRRQCFLTYLNEGNSGGYDCFDEPQDIGELGIVRSCLGRRRAARDSVGDRCSEPHCSMCSGAA